VAVSSAGEGASLELATGKPVLAMGGFTGSDPAMTVAKLQQLVRSGQLRYVLVGGGPGGGGRAFDGPGGSAAGSGPNTGTESVMTWVTQHGKAVDYGGSSSGGGTLYDLSGAA
jgi:hypothetical protein